MKFLGSLAVAGILFFGAAPASAQTIGFKLGQTFSNLDVNDDDTEENRLSAFGGGGFLRFGVGGLGLQIDVLALTKGAETDGPGDDDAQIKLEYIEVPVQLVLSLGGGRFSPYVLAGPSFAFEVGCDLEFAGGGDNQSIECDAAGTEFPRRKSTDIGVTGAAGLQIPLGPGALLVEGRYTHGLTNIIDEPNSGLEAKNRSFGLFAGYSISLGR